MPGVFLYPGFSLGAVFDKVGLAAYTLTDYGTRWTGDSLYDDLIEAYATSPNDPSGYRQVMGDSPDSESRLTSYVVSPVAAKEIVPGLSFGRRRPGGLHEPRHDAGRLVRGELGGFRRSSTRTR